MFAQVRPEGQSPLFIPGTHFTPQPGPSTALLLTVYPSGHRVSQALLPHPAQRALGDQKPHSFSPRRSPQGRWDETGVPGDTRVLMALTPRSHASVLGGSIFRGLGLLPASLAVTFQSAPQH